MLLIKFSLELPVATSTTSLAPVVYIGLDLRTTPHTCDTRVCLDLLATSLTRYPTLRGVIINCSSRESATRSSTRVPQAER